MRSLFLYGVPGSGKTHTSLLMSSELGLELLEADTLKAGLNLPSTCRAWKEFGEFDRENALKGLMFVRESLRDIVKDAIENRTGLLIEGAFLDPRDLASWGEGLLIVKHNEEKHRQQFFAHRQENDENKEVFVVARWIQEFLITEANDLGIKIHENT